MGIAARLAMRGIGRVEPNPCVGAVLVRDGAIVGRGYHRSYGEAHAEVEAISDCRRRGNSPQGAAMYVTLEPCNHTGKTPPCTEAILKAGIGELIYAAIDPNPAARGGASRLEAAGVRVRICDTPMEAPLVSAPFRKRTHEGLPWVISKWAQSIDGKIARGGGDSKWISNASSRLSVHRLRSRVDAIIVGVNTVLRDDPLLTVRGVPIRGTPLRVVLDSNLRVPIESQLVQTARQVPVLIFCSLDTLANHEAKERELVARGAEVVGVPSHEGRVDCAEVLRFLTRNKEAERVLVEGGAGVLGSFFALGLIDELRIFQAPFLLSNEGSVQAIRPPKGHSLIDSVQYTLQSVRRIHSDLEVRYVRSRYAHCTSL